MNWFKKLFMSKKEKELEKQVIELRAKLDERQEAINKTNAYWKRKVHDLTRKKTSANSL